MKKQTVFITRTAMFIAILIAVQIVTKSFGQLVTGSCVNLILAVCAVTCGLGSATVVAILSPFMAFLLGIGTPIIQIVPLITLGNFVYVAVISVADKKYSGAVKDVAAVAVAAAVKFLVLFITVTKVAVPLLGLPEAKAAVISASFSWPQLITALIGGLIAREAINVLKKYKRTNA